MKRYASRDNMFDKAYDSLGSGCGSQERLHTEGGNLLAKQSTKQLASVGSLQDFLDDSRRSIGQNKINLREFREKMI